MLVLALLATGWAVAPAVAQEEGGADGKWNPPLTNLPVWESKATGLRFPIFFSDYVMQGVFDFAGANGDHIVRYESAGARARGDIFIQKKDPPPADKEAVVRAIDDALVQAMDDLAGMAEQGRYDDIKTEGPLQGKIELWKVDEPLPLLIQQLAATRIGAEGGKPERVPLKLWYGCTVFEGHVILIRHMRPAEEGEKGEADMKFFVDAILRVVKDPPLRKEMRPAMEAFVREPLTESGQEAAKIALGYLDNSPMMPVLVPAPPLTTWADEMEKLVPNSGSQILRAYVISGALAALDGKDNRTCLTLACQQVARVYLEIQRLQPAVRHAGLEDLTKAVERGEVAAWFEKQLADAAAKERK